MSTYEIKQGHNGLPALHVRDEEHTPYNKRRWEIERSTALLEVMNYDGSLPVNPKGWVSIRLEEITQAKKGGPVQSRTISITLNGAERQALIDVLTGKASA